MTVTTAKGLSRLEFRPLFARYSPMDATMCGGWPARTTRGQPNNLVCSAGDIVEFNRNQYFFLGAVILLIGLQVRMVSAYVLTEEATRFLAERTRDSAPEETLVAFTSDVGLLPNKVLHPPDWLGWCLLSVGSVLMLHSLAMPRPSG